jgi:hypothetical protein
MSAESNLQRANKREEYSNSELIPTEQSDHSVSKVQSILTQILNLWQNAIASLTEESEINEWQEKDRYNHIHWYESDPLTSECVLRDRFLRDQRQDLDR